MDNIYYVYQHIDDNGKIVYIGKGKWDRAWSIKRRDNEHIEWIKSKLPYLKVLFVAEGLEEQIAYQIEKELIKKIMPKYNLFYTEANNERLIKQGKWLAEEKSLFKNSEFQRENARKALLSPNHPVNKKLTCFHCGFISNVGNIKRYHNDNCKERVKSNDLN